ncbi:MAG: TonB-dependent receptor [Halieaceae bacterium]
MNMPTTRKPAHSASYSLTPLAAAILTTSTLFSVPLAAQERETVLEEIVVTAQRQQTMLQDTPIAVTAFTSQRIEDLGVFDISDIGSMAPNTNIQKQPSSNSNMSIFVRGVGSGETSLMVDPKVSFYIDGVYMSKTVGAVFDIVDMESIEVLRGPQGTLFGRNSAGGAINVTTVKPRGELGVRLEGSVGNDGYQRFMATVDTPKMFDMLSAKISGMTMDYDGWADNNFPGQEDDLGSENNDSYRIALRLEPMDSLTIDYSYDKTDNKGVPTPFQITKVKDDIYNGFTSVPFPYEVLGGQLYQEMAALVGDPDDRRDDYNLDAVSDEKLEVDGHTVHVSWELEPFTIKYIFADRDTDSTYDRSDLDSGAYNTADLLYGGGAVVPTPGFHAAIDDGSIDMTTHEVQLFGDLFDSRLSYTLGYYHYEEDIRQDNPQTFALPIQFVAPRDPALLAAYTATGFCNDVPGQGPVCIGSQRLPIPFPVAGADPNMNGAIDFVYGQNTESWAAYAHGIFSITDDWDLTLGIRYTEDDRNGFLFNENLGMVSIDDKLKNDDDWDNTSYLATLSYAVNDDMNVYATYSTGYNAGGFNARAATEPSWENPVDEETIDAWEIGMKAEWWNNRLRTNIAAFYNKFDDIQIAQFEAGSGGASSRLVNAGKATYQGIELDMVAVLADGLVMDLTYGYLDADFDEYLARDPATDQEVDISNVTTVARTPENTANIGLQYDFAAFSFGSLSARVDATYTDDFTFHPFQNRFDSADDRWLIGARLSLNDISLGNAGDLRVSAWGKNLTDEEYREWGIDFDSLGYAGNVYGQPRTYGLDLVYYFGENR